MALDREKAYSLTKKNTTKVTVKQTYHFKNLYYNSKE